MFALTLVIVVAAVGIAVDYGSGLRMKAAMQSSIDSAVLAAARDAAFVSHDKAETTLRTIFAANFAKHQVNQAQGGAPSVIVAIDASNTVIGTASMDLPTALMGILGIKSMNLVVTASAAVGLEQTDVALVLDNTASMTGARIDNLKSAANLLVDTAFGSAPRKEMLRMGVAPFAQYVNVGTRYAGASWLTDTQVWSRASNYCVDSVQPIYGTPCQTVTETRYNDGSPYQYSYQSCPVIGQKTVPICTSFTEISRWDGCVGSRNVPLDLQAPVASFQPVPAMFQSYVKYPDQPEQKTGTPVACNSPLTRLTSEKREIEAALSGMVTVGETYIASGLLWGWRLLSHEAPFADGVDPAVSPRRRVIVLMTDGANTRSQNSDSSPWHEGTDAAVANATTAQLCQNIKADGITLFVISYAIPEADANQMLRTCASSQGQFFTANSSSELADAFRNIASKLAGLRMTK